MGLTPLYRDNEEFRNTVRSLVALAFLQHEDIEVAYDIVRQNAPNLPQMVQFLRYFSSTFIRRPRGPSTFSPNEWSCYLGVTSDLGRTNNGQEGWHNAFRSNFGTSAHPSMSKMIVGLKNEDKNAHDRLRNHELDHTRPIIGFPRKTMYVKNDIAIKTLIDEYYGTPEDERTDAQLLLLLQALQYRVNAFSD
ncbi:hypothetical protein QR680_016636 [Steinernema hermaphroditum]|nr:hypothetical protein QR680_002740 [Steinernema hermaphroditum]KAK0402958.1 hypothetical protein QR680_016636 [Steinernema hermaphroditum]